MSGEKFDIPTATILLQEESIATALQESLAGEIKNAFDGYLDSKNSSILSYLLKEKVFEEELYDVFVSTKSEGFLETILHYIQSNDSAREIIELDVKFFQSPSELCSHFEYALTNKQLADIIAKRPIQDGEAEPVIMAYGVIDIKEKSIVNEFYLTYVTYKGGKSSIQKKPKHIFSFELKDIEGILYDLGLLFPEKNLYEIFGVDPIDVIKSK